MTFQEPLDMSSSILVLHAPALDPYRFLSRLTSTPEDDDPLRDGVPWRIDNKYYSTDVTFVPHVLGAGSSPEAYPVVLYLFSGQPSNPLPAALTRLAVRDPPPDISLAVRVKSNDNYGPLAEDADEWFDEIGMEVVDELGEADDDDERPIDPLDTVRQTLMTHMWPNMQRKPAGPRRDMPRPEAGNDESGDEDTVFPVRFSAQAAAPSAPGPASDFPTPEGSRSASPVAVGYAPVPNDADFGPFEGGLGASEYARLDAWLDDDGEVDELEHRVSQADRFFRFVDEDELSGFDDDFGPAPNRGEPALPLDPTPLLLHLQQVRADLAHVEDEDERRRRAADEVSRVMASLGFGGGDWDDPLEEVEEDIARLDRLNEM